MAWLATFTNNCNMAMKMGTTGFLPKLMSLSDQVGFIIPNKTSK